MKLKVKKLDSFREKSVGLIGANKIYPVYFTTRWGIHTFGVLFPIDVVVLDNNFRVAVMKVLKPNRIFFWNPKYSHVLELPAGSIREKTILVGSHITIEEQ